MISYIEGVEKAQERAAENEKLLEEAAEVLRNVCTAIDTEADLGRPFPTRYPNTVSNARAFLAKLEARDA